MPSVLFSKIRKRCRQIADICALDVVSPAADPPRITLASPGNFVAIVEVERFLLLRNTVGFEIAHQLLSGLAERIAAAIAEIRIGRIGITTIEFAFTADTVDDARFALTKCLLSLEEVINADGLLFNLKGTIAFACIGSTPVNADLFDELLAGLAVATNGRERVVLVDRVQRSKDALDDLQILRALPAAISAGELHLVYQPKLDSRQGAYRSAEALLRWTSPTLGKVPTERLIMLAEGTGAIRDLTFWVAKQVMQDQAILQANGQNLTVYINMSGALLPDCEFIARFIDIVTCSPFAIGIEITETAVISDPETAIENIFACAAAGLPIAIDDFGSGLSSLDYLKRLPADELKIDRKFISGLVNSHRDPLIVRAAIDLAHALEMRVTAEGVDDAMSFSLLQMMGCDLLQGYFVSHPLPLDSLLAFLEKHRDDPEEPSDRVPRRV